MPKKIVLLGARLNTNLGGPSLYISTVTAIRKFLPDAEIEFLTLAKEYEKDLNVQNYYGVKVLPFDENYLVVGRLVHKVSRLFLFKRYKKVHQILSDADIIIDIWGITFTDFLGKNTFINRFREGLRLLLGRLYGVPLIKATCALGPFKLKWNRRLARFYFEYFVDSIVARDEKSYSEVGGLGIETSLLIAPDTAFLLTPENIPPIFANDSRPNVVISVSHQARNRASGKTFYLNTMNQFIKSIIENYNVTVTLLPNELEVTEDDDLKIAQEIGQLASTTACKVIDPTNLSAMQVKGVVNQADVVVASRYHTVIAALSLEKPTITIGWHHKYRGVLSLFEMEKWNISVDELDLTLLLVQFSNLWENQSEISELLSQKLPRVKTQIYNAFSVVLSPYT